MTELCLRAGLNATGYFGPSIYLDDGGKKVEGSPEFYWGLEVRRISRDFNPPEKVVVSKETAQKPEGGEPEERPKKTSENTTESDLKDFDSAVQQARIKLADPAKAKEQHKQARSALDVTASGTPTPLPAESDKELADYQKGAAAYLNQQWDEAPAWEKICSSDRSKIDIIGRFGRRSCWAKCRLRKKIPEGDAMVSKNARARERRIRGFVRRWRRRATVGKDEPSGSKNIGRKRRVLLFDATCAG